MKVLMISNMVPSRRFPSYGIFVKNSAENLALHGFDVDLVGTRKQLNPALKIWEYIRFSYLVLWKLYSNQYDIVYAHYILHTLIPLRMFFGKKTFKMVLNAHGGDVLDFKQHMVYRFVRPIYALADLIVTPSEYYKRVIQEREPYIHQDRIFVSASGGVDTDIFSYSEPNSEALNLLFVSRIIPGKGWRTYLSALDILAEQGVSFSSRIVGDGEELSELLRTVAGKSWANKNECMGGLPQQQIKESYTWCSVFVFPTERRAESLGLVALEAMSCGRPVIGSNMAGLRDYIEHDVNGFFFPPGDSQALAKAILFYSELSAKQKESLSQKARKTALAFEKTKVANMLIERLKLLNG